MKESVIPWVTAYLSNTEVLHALASIALAAWDQMLILWVFQGGLMTTSLEVRNTGVVVGGWLCIN